MTPNDLTEKEQLLLTYFPRFRFLDRTHIQYFLHHKQKQRVNKWLKQLVTQHYLLRIYDETIIGTKKTSAIFCLRTKGIRYIRTLALYPDTFLRNFYKDTNRSEAFIQHCLLIARFCCELERKTTETCTFTYATVGDRANSENGFHFLEESGLSIDLCFTKAEEGKLRINCFLVHLRSTQSKSAIRSLLHSFVSYYFSGEWDAKRNSAFPRFLFVCDTKQQLTYAKWFARTLFEEELPEDISIHFTTTQSAKERGIAEPIWVML